MFKHLADFYVTLMAHFQALILSFELNSVKQALYSFLRFFRREMLSPVNIADKLPWVEFGNTVSAKSIWPFKTRVYASYKQKKKRLIGFPSNFLYCDKKKSLIQAEWANSYRQVTKQKGNYFWFTGHRISPRFVN